MIVVAPHAHRRTHGALRSSTRFSTRSPGRLLSTTVMITPIKRRGKHVGDTSKRPIVIRAHRGGAPLRTAELLDILNMVAPCARQERRKRHRTPAIRFPVAKLTGLTKRQRTSLTKLTMRKVMKWYHERAARVPNHEHAEAHSFRVSVSLERRCYSRQG